MSYDVVALYPSVPIKKAIDVIMQLLQEDWDDVKTSTKLSMEDIRKLLDLCLSTCYFLWENEFYTVLLKMLVQQVCPWICP